MKKYLAVFLSLFLFLISYVSIKAQVVINEFSIRPSDKQDWIELYSPENIDISGWKIGDESGIFHTISEGNKLGLGLYYVVSKYQRLDNTADTIYLYNKAGETIDSIKYGYENEVCLSDTDGSIARIPDGGNLYDRLLIATKGTANGDNVTSPCPSPTPAPSNSPLPTVKPSSTSKPASTSKPTVTDKPTSIIKPTLTTKIENSRTVSSTSNPTDFQKVVSVNNSTNQEVLGDRASQTVTSETLVPTPQVLSEKSDKRKTPILAFVFVLIGVISIIASLYPILVKLKKRYNFKDEENEID